MTIPRKTAKEISDDMLAQIGTELNQDVSIWEKAFTYALSKACGLIFVTFSQFAAFNFFQMFPKYCSSKDFTASGQTVNPLGIHGSLIKIFPSRGKRAEGDVRVTATTTTTVDSGRQMINTSNGEVYTVIGDQLVIPGETLIFVRAANYSAAATFVDGTEMSFVSAPQGVNKVCYQTSIAAVAGSDPETSEDYRERILGWWAARPQGGAYIDYRLWGKENNPDVDEIYPFSGPTPGITDSRVGTVDLYIKSKSNDGIASQVLIDNVLADVEQNVNGLADRRPMNALTLGSSVRTVNFTVESAIPIPSSADLQTKITNGVENYFKSRENYILGLSRLPRKDIVSADEVRGVIGRIAASAGATVADIAVKDDLGSPIDFYVLEEGEQTRGTMGFIA